MRGKKKPVRRGGKPTKAKVASDPARRRPAPTTDASSHRRLEQRLAEALEQHAATAEILRVISSSPHAAQPVFEAIVGSAARLCEAEFSAVTRFNEGQLHLVAINNMSPAEIEAYHSLFPRPPHRGFIIGRAFVDGRPVHVEDVQEDPDYDPRTLEVLQHAAPYRTFLGIPILRNGVPIGAIGCGRRAVRPFTATQIELVKTFADQAVIAIENVRLFTELEARNRDLTATSEILRVISGSPTDVQPVFEAIAQSARRLCDGDFCNVARYDDELLHLAAHAETTPGGLEVLKQIFPTRPSPATALSRAVLESAVVHIPDISVDVEYAQPLGQALRVRSALGVPMLREGRPIGAIAVGRKEARPFSDNEIELLKTFADQAAIAIENVRLFKELEARNRDLTETLDQQTATGEILRVISQSQTDVQPVFDTIVRSAVRLCDGLFSALFRFDGELIHQVAQHNFTPEALEGVRRIYPARPSRAHGSARAILERAVVHIPDVTGDADYLHQELTRAVGFRSGLFVPMLRDGDPIGVIMVARAEPGPFSDSEIELLKTFADQAVIAVENVRLFTELEVRNRDLTETLEQQTATSEILSVISSSPTDVQPVFDTIASNARRLCNADSGSVFTYDGTLVHLVSLDNTSPERSDALRGVYPLVPTLETVGGRAILTRQPVHISDVRDDPTYVLPTLQDAGLRSVLSVPMLRDGLPVGIIIVHTWETPRPFTRTQIDLLRTFADQAVIAIENVRLFKELEVRNHALFEALEQQTATSEILRVISGSPTDVQPVFDTIVRSAVRLCDARFALLFRLEGEIVQPVAHHNYPPEALGQFLRAASRRLADGDTIAAQAMLRGEVVHVPDIELHPGISEAVRELARSTGYRSVLAVPIMREGSPLGAIAVTRHDAAGATKPFSDEEITLLQTFTEQAVIAIENVRLFKELETRTAQLTRSVDELKALGEVSQAVSSTLDLETVLATIVSRAVQLSESHGGIVYEFDDPTQAFHARAAHQISQEHLEAVRAAPIQLGEGAVGHAGVIREPVQIADIQDERQLVAPQARRHLTRQGMRSLLAMPLVRENRLLGGLVIVRHEPGVFSPEVVASLQTFAAQSVLAFQNARLFREIQRQKQYADALVEASPVAIATMDLRGAVVGWNPSAERLFGYAQAEALGHQMEDLVGTPEIREEVRANIRQTLEGKWIQAITRRARKDGSLVDVEISSMPVVVDGAKVGMIGIYHNITELLQARREAEAANEAKGAFLATMSHEIRTPMNAVIGMSGLLLNTALTDEQREYAEIVRQSGDTLLTVINDILDFSKIEAGRLELESQPFDLRECVESALDLVATRAAEKGLDLAYLIGDGTPAAVVGDVTRLRQVLLNLLSNAVKFTEAGEVVLSVSAQRRDRRARLHDLTFTVRDTGIGIPPDRLDRLFQSFSQIDASTTRRYGGTGLGLAISQRLTELMGGRISVSSQVRVGSEFRFTIRAPASESPLPARRDLSGVQPSLRGKRVLVVDDNATNRRILTAHLDAWGMVARATESPLEALAWARGGERFDVGILDMHMPEMDGVALALAIRECLAGAPLPLILFTSLGRREARAEEAGFAAYLNKPIKPSQLFDALVSVLAEQPVHVPTRRAARSELDPEMAARHPLRILLAEDNVVNQKVALRILGQMGYRADVAANGLEAIEAVERQTYDVVLMDVQMPELDGFEASREINRRWPGEHRPRLVAMTANAMEGDRELCTAAGMDDYVAKPIRVEELVAALGRCRPRGEAGPRASSEAGGGDAAAGAGAIDRVAFERLTATMDGAFVTELIDTFLDDARGLIASIRRAMVETDRDAFRRAAHSLKSTSESLGATDLANFARELENIGRSGVLSDVGDRIERLAALYELVTRDLGALRHGLAR
jgi:PAS domain S-box-containing protein